MTEKQTDSPNPGHFYEIADRCHIINSMIDDFLIEHPGMTDDMKTICGMAQGNISIVKELAFEEKERLFPDK